LVGPCRQITQRWATRVAGGAHSTGTGPTAANKLHTALVEHLGKDQVVVRKQPQHSKVPAAAGDNALDEDLRTLLGEVYRDQPLRLMRELEKLALLPTSDGRSLTVGDWRTFSTETAAADGFALARAVLRRDLAGADAQLRQWRAAGGKPSTVGRDLLGAIGFVLRQALAFRLLVAHGTPGTQAAKQVRGRLTPSDRKAINAWRIRDLAAVLDQLVRLDRDLKSSSVRAETALAHWLMWVLAPQDGRAA